MLFSTKEMYAFSSHEMRHLPLALDNGSVAGMVCSFSSCWLSIVLYPYIIYFCIRHSFKIISLYFPLAFTFTFFIVPFCLTNF